MDCRSCGKKATHEVMQRFLFIDPSNTRRVCEVQNRQRWLCRITEVFLAHRLGTLARKLLIGARYAAGLNAGAGTWNSRER